MGPESTLFVFLDGIGLGPAGPDNPLDTDAYPTLKRLAGGQRWTSASAKLTEEAHVFTWVDATLGVEGLPQSGTGQASLYTGVNAAALAGRHYGPHAPTAAHAALASDGLWARLQQRGLPPERLAYANAFPDRFYAYGTRTNRWPTAARMARLTGIRMRGESDVRDHLALTAEITGAAWRDHLGAEVPVWSPQEAGALLADVSRAHTVTLFEFFDSDTIGHRQDAAQAREVLWRLDAFFEGILAHFDPASSLLLICSDHGNLEALGVKTHTRAPVPLIAWGAGARAFARCTSLVDVTPALVDLVAPRAGP